MDKILQKRKVTARHLSRPLDRWIYKLDMFEKDSAINLLEKVLMNPHIYYVFHNILPDDISREVLLLFKGSSFYELATLK